MERIRLHEVHKRGRENESNEWGIRKREGESKFQRPRLPLGISTIVYSLRPDIVDNNLIVTVGSPAITFTCIA